MSASTISRHEDAQGVLFTGTAAAVDLINLAVDDYYGWKGDPVALLEQAASADNTCMMADTALATLFVLNGIPGSHAMVATRLAAAEAKCAKASDRERQHLDAARQWAAGNILKACDAWESILVDHPRDALALRFAHDTYFYLGHSNSIRDSVARVLPFWERGTRNHGFVLGQYAFGLEETGDLARAEAVGLDALETNPRDAWAAHAIAHVYETQSRQADGINFLRRSRPDWSTAHALSVHNGWHLALYMIEDGKGAEVLGDYDRFIMPKLAGDSLLDLVDASSLLWRLELAGVDVGNRWTAVADQWMTHVDDHVLVFNDLHIAMAAVRAGGGRIKKLKASLERYEREGIGDNRDITLDVGRTIVDAFIAYGEGDFATAVDLLLPVRFKAIRIGGSHAQRDVVTQTLIAAAERSGRRNLLRNLLAERLALRPTTRSHDAFQALQAH